MPGHRSAVLCLHVSNRMMYTGGADSIAKGWIKEYGECTRQFKGHGDSVICMKLQLGTRELSYLLPIHIPYRSTLPSTMM